MHMIILWYAYTEDWCVRFYLKAVSPLDGLASMTKIKSSFASFHFNTCLTLWLLRNTTKWSDNIQAVNGNTQQTNGGGGRNRTVVLPKYRVDNQTAEVSFWQHSVWTGIQVSSTYEAWVQVNVKWRPLLNLPYHKSTAVLHTGSTVEVQNTNWLAFTANISGGLRVQVKEKHHTWENNSKNVNILNS